MYIHISCNVSVCVIFSDKMAISPESGGVFVRECGLAQLSCSSI